MEEIEIIIDDHTIEEESIIKSWQWVYKTKNSPIWDITKSYLTKEAFNEFLTQYNNSTNNPIIEYRKVKVSKIIKNEPL